MALFDMDFPDDFMSELLGTDFDDMAEDMLKEAAPLLQNSLKVSAKRAVLHEGESDMVDSIEPSNPKKAKTGAWIVNVGPQGASEAKVYFAKDKKGVKTKRKYKVSNALKAIWKEYGIEGRQAPRPFIQNATNNARNAVMESMQNTYSRKVGGE